MNEHETESLPHSVSWASGEARDLIRQALSDDDELLFTLHQRCEDKSFALKMITALKTAAPHEQESAAHWLNAIRDMHPDH